MEMDITEKTGLREENIYAAQFQNCALDKEFNARDLQIPVNRNGLGYHQSTDSFSHQITKQTQAFNNIPHFNVCHEQEIPNGIVNCNSNIKGFGESTTYSEQTDEHKYLDHFQRCVNELNKQKINPLNENIQNQDSLNEKMLSYYSNLVEFLNSVPELVEKVKVEWKEHYKRTFLEYPFNNYLDLIQDCFGSLLECILFSRSLIVNPKEPTLKYLKLDQIQINTKRIIDNLDQILEKLLIKSFIIEKHPFIVHKENQIEFICRFLFKPNQNGCQLICDNFQINLQLEDKIFMVEKDQVMKFNLELKNEIELDHLKIVGLERKWSGNENVTQKLAQFNFSGRITLVMGNKQITTDFQEYSLPVSVITHSRQKGSAIGALIWYHLLDNTPKGIESGRVKTILNDMFVNRFGTGFGLSKRNLNFLEKKLMGDNYGKYTRVTKGQLLGGKAIVTKEGKIDSFWNYFYNAYKLISDHFENLWKEGLIVGFISESESKAILSRTSLPPSCFLLKFKETVKNGIVITYYEHGKLKYLETGHLKLHKETKLHDLLKYCGIKDEPNRDNFTHVYTKNGFKNIFNKKQ